MRNYTVYLDYEIIGSVNLSNCNCSKFIYLGTDLSGNTMVYRPGLHTIKECLLDSTSPQVHAPICSLPIDPYSPHRKACNKLGRGEQGFSGTQKEVNRICNIYYHEDTRTMCVVDPLSGPWTDWSCMDSNEQCPTPAPIPSI